MSYPHEGIAALRPVCGEHYFYFFEPEGALKNTAHFGDFAAAIYACGKEFYAALGRADHHNTHLLLKNMPQGTYELAQYAYSSLPINTYGAIMALAMLGHSPVDMLAAIRSV